MAIQADATDAAAVSTAIEKTVAAFGKLDVLVNNAGTAIPKPFEEATLEELDRVIDINLRGVLYTTHAALKHMNNGGRIIMIGSCVGERIMTPGLTPYSATKGAVKMFAQGLSREVGDADNGEQRTTGSDRHRFKPCLGRLGNASKSLYCLNRYGSVKDVAALVAFLAGPEAGYITGASLTVDGGTNA